jgi:hypothetical protein
MLAMALVVAHGLPAVAALSLTLPIGLKLAVGALLLASLGATLWRRVLRPPLVALTLKVDGTMEIHSRDGSVAAARISPQTTVFPWLVVLPLRIDSAAIALALPSDALPGDGHRQLRLWLRWLASVRAA